MAEKVETKRSPSEPLILSIDDLKDVASAKLPTSARGGYCPWASYLMILPPLNFNALIFHTTITQSVP